MSEINDNDNDNDNDNYNKDYEEKNKILKQISNTIDKNAIHLIKQNSMYDGAYLYTLNRYRNLLLNEVKQYNSSLDMTKSNASSNTIPIETKEVDLYLLKRMKEHYFP